MFCDAPGRFLNIVLDLDETLISQCTATEKQIRNLMENDAPSPDAYIHREGSKTYHLIWKRPWVEEFLERLRRDGHFVFLFTAGERTHQESIVDLLGWKKYFVKLYYRDSCVVKEGGIIEKHLSSLQLVDRLPTIFVDDSKLALSLNGGLCLPVAPFVGLFGKSDLIREKLLLEHVYDVFAHFADNTWVDVETSLTVFDITQFDNFQQDRTRLLELYREAVAPVHTRDVSENKEPPLSLLDSLDTLEGVDFDTLEADQVLVSWGTSAEDFEAAELVEVCSIPLAIPKSSLSKEERPEEAFS